MPSPSSTCESMSPPMQVNDLRGWAHASACAPGNFFTASKGAVAGNRAKLGNTAGNSGAYRSAVPTPVMTHVCKRGGRPPSAFRLLPCGSTARSLHTSALRSSRTPYFEVLDQNRWTSTCIADTLRCNSSRSGRGIKYSSVLA